MDATHSEEQAPFYYFRREFIRPFMVFLRGEACPEGEEQHEDLTRKDLVKLKMFWYDEEKVPGATWKAHLIRRWEEFFKRLGHGDVATGLGDLSYLKIEQMLEMCFFVQTYQVDLKNTLSKTGTYSDDHYLLVKALVLLIKSYKE